MSVVIIPVEEDLIAQKALEKYSTTEKTQAKLDLKADKTQLASYYTKGETDAKLNTKANQADLISNYYTKTEVDAKDALKANDADLHKVAKTGNYNDLNNLPSLFDGKYTSLTGEPDLTVFAKSDDLADVAFSGQYADLKNKPSIPTLPSNIVESVVAGSHISINIADPKNPIVSYTGSPITYLGSLSTWIEPSAPEVGDMWYVVDTNDFRVYNGTTWDIINMPVQVQTDWNTSDTADNSFLKNKPDLAVYAKSADLNIVATTGDYNDLENLPTLPSNTVEEIQQGVLITVDATNPTKPIVSTNIKTDNTITGTGLASDPYTIQPELDKKQDISLNDNKLYALLNGSVSEISKPGKDIYVDSNSAEAIENGSIYFPFKTIMAALTFANSGGSYTIHIASGSGYNENVTIANKSNITIKGDSVIGQYRAQILGTINIIGTSERIGISNLEFKGAFTHDCPGGLVYVDNCSFDGLITTVNSENYLRFDYCFIETDAHLDGASFVDIRDSQFENEGIVYQTNGTLYLQDVTGITLNHSGGIVSSNGASAFTSNTTQTDGIVSTSDTGALLLFGGSLFDGQTYHTFNKTGLCPYTLGEFMYEPTTSALAGIKVDSGLHSEQIFDHFVRIGYTQVEDSLRSHLDAIAGTLVNKLNVSDYKKSQLITEEFTYSSNSTFGLLDIPTGIISVFINSGNSFMIPEYTIIDNNLTITTPVLTAGDNIEVKYLTGETEVDSYTADYTGITNKPQINNVTLKPGNNTLVELGIADDTMVVHKAGDTMTGKLILSNDPTDDLGAATKKYVDDKANTLVPKSIASSTATATNYLVDKDFVNSTISTLSAHYLTYNSAGDPFPTKLDLTNATTLYYQGTTFTPTINDYLVVKADESQGGAQTRYVYDGVNWDFQYIVNNTPFTQAQNDAINSGITATKVTKYDGYDATITGKEDKSNKNIANGYAPLDASVKVPIANLPKAAQTTLGLVMGGAGITIDSDGKINWTGQIKQITYWLAALNISTGAIGGTTAADGSLVTKASGQGDNPAEGDIVISQDGYQYVVTTVDVDGKVNGVIIVTPPASAVWSTITGSLNNVQYIPAQKSDGSTVNIFGVNSSDVVTAGASSTGFNILTASGVRAQNNANDLAYVSDITTAKTELNTSITTVDNNLTTAKTTLQTNIDNEKIAREQADNALQTNLTTEVTDRGNADTVLQANIDALIDDTTATYSTTYSSKKIEQAITLVYHTTADVATATDLPNEADLDYPSICYVIDEAAQYINSKTGNGWHKTGGNFLALEDMTEYLTDNKYIKGSEAVDNVTTADSQKALSANMGKWLNDNKLSATQVIDNVVTSDTTNPLSANQGKWLNENKLGKTDVIDNATSINTDKPLSANQGKLLNDKVVTLNGYFTGGKANTAAVADTATSADKWTSPINLGVTLNGYASGSGTISLDGSGNKTITITTTGATSGGVQASGSLPIINSGSNPGWVYLGQFTLGYTGTIKMSYQSGMSGYDYTVWLGTRSGTHTVAASCTVLNQQGANFNASPSTVRIYSTNVYPNSTYKIYLYKPNYSGGVFELVVSAENGATVPTLKEQSFTPGLLLTDMTNVMFPSVTDFPRVWSLGGANNDIRTYPIGYTSLNPTPWWSVNPKA